MKRLLTLLACLACFTLDAFITHNDPIERQDNSREEFNFYFAKGFKGGGRGFRRGPSSKRRDPNQSNLGNNKGKEHITNRTENNRQKQSDDKNDQLHGKA